MTAALVAASLRIITTSRLESDWVLHGVRLVEHLGQEVSILGAHQAVGIDVQFLGECTL